MGKLKDAILRYRRELAAHRSTPQPSFIENPAAAAEYSRRGMELQYMADAVQAAFAEEFGRLKPELQTAFLNKTLSVQQKKRLAAEKLDHRLKTEPKPAGADMEAYWGGSRIFGRPIAECLDAIRRYTNQANLSANPLTGVSPYLQAFILMNSENMTPENRKSLYVELVTDERLEQDLEEQHVLAGLMETGEYRKLLESQNSFASQEDFEQGLELLEQGMSEAEINAAAERLSGVPTWTARKDRSYSPAAAQLDSLEAGLQGLPKAEAASKKQLLQQAREILVFPGKEYVKYLNNQVGGTEDFPGPEKLNEQAERFQISAALQALPIHNLAQKLPHRAPEQPQHAPFYSPGDVYPPAGSRRNGGQDGLLLEDRELQTLREGYDMPLPPAAKQAILSIYANIQKIGAERYARSGIRSVKYDQAGNPIGFRLATEQAVKYYAFYPLTNAKQDLLDAVQKQDWGKMQAAIQEYTSLKPLCDQMMRDASSICQEPIFPPNVNSTRPLRGDAPSPMPMEYLEDVTGHSRVNGIYRLYALHHNTGVPVEKLLDHPGAALQELSQQMVQERIDPAFRGAPLGGLLARCLSQEAQFEAQNSWAMDVTAMSQVLSVVDGFVTDPLERQKLSGRNYGAVAAANYSYRQQLLPWQAVANGKEAQRIAFVRAALLTPTNQLNLRTMAGALRDPHWEKQLNPGGMIEQMRQAGSLDPAALTARTRQALAEMRAEQAKPVDQRKQLIHEAESKTNLHLLRKAALQNYRQLLRLTTGSVLNTEGWQALQQHTTELQDQLLRDSAGKWRTDRASLDNTITLLSREKTGPFLSKTNSPAYERMMKALRRFQAKLDLARGKAVQPGALTAEELEQLRDQDAGQLFQKAKQACISYCSEKTDAGRKGFIHQAGSDRYRYAMDAVELMGSIADEAAIRNPAMALKDRTVQELLNRRDGKTWLRENGERAVAGTLYALHLHFKGVSPEKQAELLEGNRLNTAIQRIRSDPAFQNMLRREGLSKLTDLTIAGPAKLSEAYMNAVQRVNNQPPARNPQRSAQQAMEFWKNANLMP